MDNPVRLLLLPVGAALLVACGSSGGTSTEGSSAASATVAPSTTAAVTTAAPTGTLPDGAGESTPTDEPVAGDVQEIMINVDDPAQVGKTIPVKLGQTVVLRLLSDTDQTYHVHGYDLEQKTAAGVEASFEFTADQAGSFEVESHTTDKVLAVLQVA
jgi:FtsP/CotA-like multicopper oxidase with cupredoxin domain